MEDGEVTHREAWIRMNNNYDVVLLRPDVQRAWLVDKSGHGQSINYRTGVKISERQDVYHTSLRGEAVVIHIYNGGLPVNHPVRNW
jgi:hypothetical protein